MKRLIALAVLALSACAADQSYLDRWDDPRVIQIAIPWTEQCGVVPETRPTPLAPSRIAGFEEGTASCGWYDASISIGKHNDAFIFSIDLPLDRNNPLRWNQGLAFQGITTQDLLPSLKNAIDQFNLTASPYQDLCLTISYDQSLLVEEVFDIHNQIRSLGISCVWVLSSLYPDTAKRI